MILSSSVFYNGQRLSQNEDDTVQRMKTSFALSLIKFNIIKITERTKINKECFSEEAKREEKIMFEIFFNKMVKQFHNFFYWIKKREVVFIFQQESYKGVSFLFSLLLSKVNKIYDLKANEAVRSFKSLVKK